MAVFKSLLSCICCPFTTCYKLTTCCCYICAKTTNCCLNLCRDTGICCADLWFIMDECCIASCISMCSVFCNAEVWMKIFWCCNCCCPDDGNGSPSSVAAIAVSLATSFPPLGVFYKYRFGIHFWICLLLTILGYLPGMFYAIYVLRSEISLHEPNMYSASSVAELHEPNIYSNANSWICCIFSPIYISIKLPQICFYLLKYLCICCAYLWYLLLKYLCICCAYLWRRCMSSVFFDAEVWMKIFWCCNCCCPVDDDNGSPSPAAQAVSDATTFPPLGVFCKYGIGIHFWICFLLTILGYLPGMFYAIFVLQDTTPTSKISDDEICVVSIFTGSV